MVKIPKFFGIHAEPTLRMNRVLTILPFVILISVYLASSYARLTTNPDDKLLPSISKMVESVGRLAFTEDKRSGDYVMLDDTLASLKRMVSGMFLAASSGLIIGLNIGLFPGMRAMFLTFFTFLSIVPPLAILPILFIVFGVDELAKVVLIFIGTFFVIARDMNLTVEKIPKEQITKALTLGASQLQVVYRIILPQVMPRLIDATRLSLGSAWIFLIASEAIASTGGLGYRIYLVRRYLAMDIIIPYVLWITFIGFLMDWLLKKFIIWKYSWYRVSER
ncbi:lipid kinase [Candidatus Azambacteria bacterium RIFOXYD1_FULL_42_11]|uniref:Lipid kinase n=1 Tax=Candidatus Azambacteria bacterium RIFOXYD1_FULL_42_11 TaxID=1797310 RepID=A0A1F5CH66_9BACT|nr:MAG: lipid kinase [Candidatus Azambacteria bacterium RIFOXYD1_FULL_42_11]